ncbi:citrinin biosynthesis oxydoreductase CtnB [Aspergillus luchuensis]|uniref:Citrinin biosynthesis oxydoreductase CtnB n=1 Tax=Aspergillus kawachii TaxID=1069201 RepID=A0A146F4T8_ASPKA|nr:citrinin biosynthesis oxydoreductase CtnB [Aspergillus luchuensis]
MQETGLEYHGELLGRYCDGQTASMVEWEGNHRVRIRLKDSRVVVEKVLRVAQKTGSVVPSAMEGGWPLDGAAIPLDRQGMAFVLPFI